MKRSLRKEAKKTIAALLAGLLLAYAFTALRMDGQSLTALPKVELYRILCDAFTIPGLLLLAFAFLLLMSNQGVLDGVGYLAANALRFLMPAGGARMENYKAYLERRRANRAKGYGFLFVAGGILLLIAGIFLLCFYAVFKK